MIYLFSFILACGSDEKDTGTSDTAENLTTEDTGEGEESTDNRPQTEGMLNILLSADACSGTLFLNEKEFPTYSQGNLSPTLFPLVPIKFAVRRTKPTSLPLISRYQKEKESFTFWEMRYHSTMKFLMKRVI